VPHDGDQREASGEREKLTIWPSAFGPASAANRQAPPSEGSELRSAPDVDPGDKTAKSSEPGSAQALDLLLERLQPEIERRAEAEVQRLIGLTSTRVQEAQMHLHSELQEELAASRTGRADVADELQQLKQLREQIETRLNAVTEAVRQEVELVRDPLLKQVRKETQEIVCDFQDKTTGDGLAHERKLAAASVQLEKMQYECTRLASELQRRFDQDQAASIGAEIEGRTSRCSRRFARAYSRTSRGSSAPP
jgi:hypothetical protein